MDQLSRIVQLLGGEQVLGRKIHSEAELIEVIRAGMSTESLTALSTTVYVTTPAVKAVSGLIGLGYSIGEPASSLTRVIASRLFHRRKLSPSDSDRTYRLARIAAQAEEVLGSMEKASHWLREPNDALGGATPISLLDTDLGTRQVENVLGRIEHGVYS